MYRAEKNLRDFKYILNRLRKEDKEEIKAVFGKHWKKKSIENLIHTDFQILLGKTKNGNIPVLMGGAWAVDKNNPAVATVWMLSTPEIEKHQNSFLKELKKEIKYYDEKFAITFNHIYKSNTLAKRWLKWVGYRFPNEEKRLTHLDKAFLSVKVPDGFEIFYRERPVKGLGE